MKKTLITATAVATTALTAQAQDKSNTQPDNLNLFGAYSAGYLFDTEEVQHIFCFGVEHISTQYYLQLGTHNWERNFSDESYEIDYFSVSAGVNGRRLLARNLVGYIGGSAGFMNVDLTETDEELGRLTDDDWVFYTDAVTGLELLVSDNISFNTGLRLIYADDYGTPDGSFNVLGRDLDKSVDFAAELGITIRF